MRRVKQGEPMPIHSAITANTTSPHFSRDQYPDSCGFFSLVTSPKNTRWYAHNR